MILLGTYVTLRIVSLASIPTVHVDVSVGTTILLQMNLVSAQCQAGHQ